MSFVLFNSNASYFGAKSLYLLICNIVSRHCGRRCVSENAPEITACEAITVAAVASSTTGTSAQPGSKLKNGLSTASG